MCVSRHYFSLVWFFLCVFCVQVWKHIQKETLPYKEKNEEKGETGTWVSVVLIFLRTQRKSENIEQKQNSEIDTEWKRENRDNTDRDNDIHREGREKERKTTNDETSCLSTRSRARVLCRREEIREELFVTCPLLSIRIRFHCSLFFFSYFLLSVDLVAKAIALRLVHFL